MRLVRAVKTYQCRPWCYVTLSGLHTLMSSGRRQSSEFAKAEIFTASNELCPLRKTGLARFYDDRWKMHLSSGY